MRVSVIVPCYNGAAYLRAALDSVLRQQHAATEIVVADDGSTDGSVAIAESYGSPVSVVRGPFGGAPAARRAGLAHARDDAQAYLFLDADDLLGRDALSALVDVLEVHPTAVARCAWYRYERINGAWRIRPPSCTPRQPGQDDLAAWLTGWYHPPCSILWSRAAYERSGGWDPEVLVNNDGDLMMRALVNGVRLVPAREGEAFYRRHPQGGSLSAARHTPQGIQSRLAVTDRIAEQLAEQGRRARYAGALREAYRLITHTPAAAVIEKPIASEEADRPHPAGRGGRSSARQVQPISPGEEPLVTVIIPTYNRPDDTVRAVRSVLAQTYPHLELLVVDDASTDDTAARVASVDDPRVTVLRQPTNRGVASARNRGLAEARGSLIAFLDSDDVWLPDKLRRQVITMGAAPAHVGIVYTGAETRFPDGTVERFYASEGGDMYRDLLERNVLHGGGSSLLVRRTVPEAIGGFDTSLPAVEDWDYWIRAARLFDIAAVPEPLVRYYDDPDQDRRSRNFLANARARQMLYDLHREAMRAVGIAHRYQRESIYRILRDQGGWSEAGFRLILHILLSQVRDFMAATRGRLTRAISLPRGRS